MQKPVFLSVDVPIAYSDNGGRSLASIVATPESETWIDNVLELQNRTRRETDNAAGNAAIRFLNSAGTEVAAFGYSRDLAIDPVGYYPNRLYAEIGNPFGGTTTDFSVLVTHHDGTLEPHSGWEAFSISGDTGDARFGGVGTVQQVAIGMLNCLVRIRERTHVNDVGVSVNLSDAGQKDDPTLSSWVLRFGAGLDELVVLRSAPGAGAPLTTLFKIASDGGVVVGNPAGGSMGPGTINALAVYKNGVAL